MSASKGSLSFILKKSSDALFSSRRCGTQKMFHSSSHMNSAKRSYKIGSLLDQGRKQVASSSSWRSYLLPIGLLGVLGGIGGGIRLLQINDEKRALRNGQSKNDGYSNQNNSVRRFKLIGSDGKLVTEKDLQGEDWILIYFGYTSSPDVGPTELAKLVKAISTLDSEHNIKVRPVFVTLDPQRDTPSHLRAYLKEFDERIMGLTGPVGAVRQMANAYRVFFRKVEDEGDDYLVETPHEMYLMNPNMNLVTSFGLRYTADQLSQEILKEIHKTPK